MYEKLKDFQLSILGLFLAVAVVMAACVATKNISKDIISVTGSAFEVVKSDSANWRIELKTKAPTNAEAYNILKKQLPIVNEYLISKGITAKQIDLAPASSFPNYKTDPKTGYSTNEISSYNYSQTITINSNDVEKIKQLSTDIQNLVNKGLDINSYAPEYQYSKIAELKIKLLEQATIDSKKRAQAMLKANRNTIGKIQSVRMGVFQITSPESIEVTDYGVNDTSTIDKKITAVANVNFRIK